VTNKVGNVICKDSGDSARAVAMVLAMKVVMALAIMVANDISNGGG